MLLGAFLDGFVPLKHLRNELQKISIGSYELQLTETSRHHISAKKFTVEVKQDQHGHRHLSDILKTIDRSDLSEFVKQNSAAVFQKLGEEEARIHSIPLEKVHFHEVGAVDSIVDIVGVFICLNYLQPEAVYASPLPVSKGSVDAAHGVLPIPAPATLSLLRGYPLTYLDIDAELVTPTGAALVSHIASGMLPEHQSFSIERIGYGAGSKDFQQVPNLLRIWSGELNEAFDKETAIQIETNIDDLNPEIYPYLQEKLFAAGVMDVSIYPNIMKKGRPGVLLTVLCDPGLFAEIRQILFKETSSIGFRYHYVAREMLPRSIKKVDSPWGKLKVKEVRFGKEVRWLPEYEECKRIAEEKGQSLQEVYKKVGRFLEARKK